MEEETKTKFILENVELLVVTFTYSKKEIDQNKKPTGKYRQSVTMEIQVKDLPATTQKQIMKTIKEALS